MYVLQRISIYFWYSGVLYTSQEVQVVENAENGIFASVFSNLMSIFSLERGHSEKRVPKP